MDTTPNPTPTPPPVTYPTVRQGSSVGKIILWIIGGIILLAVIGVGIYFGYRAWKKLPLVSAPSQFELLGTSGFEWFSLQGTTVTSETGPSGFDSITPKILDATQQLKSNDIPVIAEIKGTPTTENQLGLIRNKGFLSLLTLTKNDTNPKADLIARNDGTLVFAESTSTTSRSWNLFSLSLYSSPQTFLPLGPGFDPEFSTTSGAVLAVAPAGLVRVDPAGNGRFTLVAQTGINYAEAAISPDATLALLPNSITKTLDLFSIDPMYATKVSYLGSVHDASSTAAAFVSPTSFVVEDASNHFTEYNLENKKIVSTPLSFKTP